MGKYDHPVVLDHCRHDRRWIVVVDEAAGGGGSLPPKSGVAGGSRAGSEAEVDPLRDKVEAKEAPHFPAGER